MGGWGGGWEGFFHVHQSHSCVPPHPPPPISLFLVPSLFLLKIHSSTTQPPPKKNKGNPTTPQIAYHIGLYRPIYDSINKIKTIRLLTRAGAPRYKEWSGCAVMTQTKKVAQLGGMGSAVSSPIGVWSSAPAAIGFCVL